MSSSDLAHTHTHTHTQTLTDRQTDRQRDRHTQGSHSLAYKKCQDVSRTLKHFSRTSRKPAMFKNSNRQQLGSLGERCNLLKQGPGLNPGRESIFGIPADLKRTNNYGNNYGYLRLQKHVCLKPKTATHIVA